MRVYLVQHGKALDKEDDASRPLSPEGIEDVEAVGHFLAAQSFDIRQVWHSGKARAAQTAERLQKLMAPKAELVERDDLNPSDNVKLAAKEIEKQAQDVMVVGHMPHMSALAAYLLVGDDEADVVQFHKGGVVCLSNDEGHWQVVWVVVPELFK